MKHYRAHQIDKVKWDELVLSSPWPIIYTISWFLDAAYPRWEAIIWEKEGRYLAAIPLPRKSVGPFHWVQIPYYVQQTGLVHRKEEASFSYLLEFFTSDFSKNHLSFNIGFPAYLKQEVDQLAPKAWRRSSRKNFLLDLERPVALLLSQFNENRKRNLKKAYGKGWTCETSTRIDAALEMYQTFQMPKQAEVNRAALKSIHLIYAAAQQRGLSELYAVKDSSEDQVLAYSLFIRFEGRLYFFFSAMNDEGKTHSASSLPFDYIIKKYANQPFTLDFEGGNSSSIGQYFASFGATPEEYLSLSFIKWAKLIRHRE